MFNFKTFFVNHKDKSGEAVDKMLKIYDQAGYSVWFLNYEKYKGEGEVLFKTENLCKGFLQRFKTSENIHSLDTASLERSRTLKLKVCGFLEVQAFPRKLLTTLSSSTKTTQNGLERSRRR